MEYKKIDKKGVTYHLIKTNRFKIINIVLFFTKNFDKKNICVCNFITNTLVYSSKKYDTKNKMASRGEDLYGAKVSASYAIVGNCESFAFTLDFLNPKYTSPSYLDESLDFFYEVIMNPNVKNNAFDKEYFEIVRNDTIATYNSIKDNPNMFAGIEFSKIMYKGTPNEYSTYPSVEECKKITPEELYTFYKSLFDGTYKVDVCILGDVEDSIVDKVYEKFKSIKSNNNKYKFMINHKYDGKVIEKIDSLPYNQSKLYIGYRLNDMTYHELNHVMKVYNTILGTMNDSILFNVVREANSLCYSIGSYVSKYNPALIVYAGINKDNYDKTIELIKECVSNMSDRKELSRLFESAKKTINTYLNNYYDDMMLEINNYYNAEFDTVEDVETLRENINNVTIDEIIEINKKISLSTIYMLKGDNN